MGLHLHFDLYVVWRIHISILFVTLQSKLCELSGYFNPYTIHILLAGILTNSYYINSCATYTLEYHKIFPKNLSNTCNTYIDYESKNKHPLKTILPMSMENVIFLSKLQKKDFVFTRAPFYYKNY